MSEDFVNVNTNSLILRDLLFKKNKSTIPQFEQQSPQRELNTFQLEEALTLYEWRFFHKFGYDMSLKLSDG